LARSSKDFFRLVSDEKVRMPIPLYGFLEGDTLGLLMLAEEGETVLQLAQKLQQAASLRVARVDQIDFIYNGKASIPGSQSRRQGFKNWIAST